MVTYNDLYMQVHGLNGVYSGIIEARRESDIPGDLSNNKQVKSLSEYLLLWGVTEVYLEYLNQFKGVQTPLEDSRLIIRIRLMEVIRKLKSKKIGTEQKQEELEKEIMRALNNISKKTDVRYAII